MPEDFRVGLVKFGSTAEQVVEPTTDRTRMRLALRGLSVAGATAMGDGLALGLDAARTPGARRPRRHPPPAGGDRAALRRRQHPRRRTRSTSRRGPRRRACASTRSRSAPAAGVLETKQPDGTRQDREGPAGHADAAGDRARHRRALLLGARRRPKLESVYSGLATRLATRQEKQEVTAAFAGGGLVLLLGGLALSMLRGGRLP